MVINLKLDLTMIIIRFNVNVGVDVGVNYLIVLNIYEVNLNYILKSDHVTVHIECTLSIEYLNLDSLC